MCYISHPKQAFKTRSIKEFKKTYELWEVMRSVAYLYSCIDIHMVYLLCCIYLCIHIPMYKHTADG